MPKLYNLGQIFKDPGPVISITIRFFLNNSTQQKAISEKPSGPKYPEKVSIS